LSVATYVLATTNSGDATLAAQVASGIAGFMLIMPLPGFAIFAARYVGSVYYRQLRRFSNSILISDVRGRSTATKLAPS
jgi:hypothetical protein